MSADPRGALSKKNSRPRNPQGHAMNSTRNPRNKFDPLFRFPFPQVQNVPHYNNWPPAQQNQSHSIHNNLPQNVSRNNNNRYPPPSTKNHTIHNDPPQNVSRNNYHSPAPPTRNHSFHNDPPQYVSSNNNNRSPPPPTKNHTNHNDPPKNVSRNNYRSPAPSTKNHTIHNDPPQNASRHNNRSPPPPARNHTIHNDPPQYVSRHNNRSPRSRSRNNTIQNAPPQNILRYNNRSPPPRSRSHTSYNARQPKEESPTFHTSDLLEVVQAIRRELQCCGCEKHLQAAWFCPNGHGVCLDCKRQYRNFCPQCNTGMADKIPAILDKIIKLLPRHCKFLDSGCEAELLAKNDDHERFCRFRLTTCEMADCVWNGPACHLMGHLTDKHNNEVVRYAKSTRILVDFDCTANRRGELPIIAFNNVFWQYTVVKDRRLVQFYRFLPMGQATWQFSVFVSYHTPEHVVNAWIRVHPDSVPRAALEGKKGLDTFRLEASDTAAFHRYYSGVEYSFEVTDSAA